MEGEMTHRWLGCPGQRGEKINRGHCLVTRKERTSRKKEWPIAPKCQWGRRERNSETLDIWAFLSLTILAHQHYLFPALCSDSTLEAVRQMWWLTPVIPSTQETEGGSQAWGQPGLLSYFLLVMTQYPNKSIFGRMDVFWLSFMSLHHIRVVTSSRDSGDALC